MVIEIDNRIALDHRMVFPEYGTNDDVMKLVKGVLPAVLPALGIHGERLFGKGPLRQQEDTGRWELQYRHFAMPAIVRELRSAASLVLTQSLEEGVSRESALLVQVQESHMDHLRTLAHPGKNGNGSPFRRMQGNI